MSNDMSVKSTFCHSFMITRGFVAQQLPPRCHIRHSRDAFAPLHASWGRVNKSCHHSHASMRGGGLLTR